MHQGARRLLAVAGVLALLAVSCGGSDDGGGSTTGSGEDASTDATAASECQWPMWGQNLDRTFSYPCETAISPETVGDLEQQWFFNTEDVVTAAPAVVEGVAYVGDWSGRFYALDTESGEELWTYDTDPHPLVYSGQIVSSAAVADVDGDRLVFFGGGKTMYALRAADGTEVWRHELGNPDDDQDPTEIQSSPAVVDGRVVFGYDAHDRPGFRAGVVALDAATGDVLWDFDPDGGDEPTGCVGVWSSPSIDTERGTVYVGSANCPSSPDGWGEYTEALYALSLDTGEPEWSFQPHEPNNDDFDFAGAPNLFTADDRAMVGLGNKDAAYYALDRESGELVWDTQATEPGIEEPGSNFSTGGFIGPTAYADGVIVGGTAVGPCPCVHAMDATTGEILWQSDVPEPTYAPAAEAGGVVFLGGTDFVLRAFDLGSGEILWEHEMQGVVAGGAAIVGDDVFAVAGLREPGSDGRSETSGVYRFSLPDGESGGDATTTSSTVAANTAPVFLEPSQQPCVEVECELSFDVFPPPEGLDPSATLLVTTTPFSVRIVAEGLGDPIEWVRPGTPAFDEGATGFAAFLSTSDDNPTGSMVCTFDENLVCEGDTIPVLEPSYNRLTILAVPSGDFELTPANGVPRLVTTFAFDPVLTVVDPP